MRFLSFLFLLFSSLLASAQITVDRTKHNYGTLSGDAVRYTDFVFTNNGEEEAFILSVKTSSRTIVYSLERKFIAAGENTRVRFLVNPTEEGKFSESAEIFVSSAPKPITVKLTGEIKGMYDLQRMACPDFSSDRNPRSTLENPIIIEVRDINTQKPIAAAKLTIIKSATEAFELKTNRDGKAEQVVPLGLYGVQCQASDYDTKIMEAYFNRTNNYLLIELGKRIIEEEEPVVAMVRPIAQEPIDEPRPRFVPKSTKTALVEEDKVIEQKKPTENYGGKAIDYDPFAEEEVEQVSEPEIEKEVFTQEPVLEEPEIVEPSVVEEPAKSTFVDNPQFSVREYKPNNIVFLIDRSVSMRNNDKLELLKQSMENLLGLLRPIDKLAVVVYATEAEVLIPSQTVENPQTFINLINGLTAGGMTNGAKGLREAFQEANNNFLDAGNNQVFLATDGAFSEGSDKIKSMAKRYGRRGISLSLIGVKNKEWTEKFLVEIADEGNGAYIHLSDESDAKFKLVEEIKQNSKIAGATRK